MPFLSRSSGACVNPCLCLCVCVPAEATRGVLAGLQQIEEISNGDPHSGDRRAASAAAAGVCVCVSVCVSMAGTMVHDFSCKVRA